MTTMEILQAARNCAPILASADTALKNKALLAMASALEADCNVILTANLADVQSHLILTGHTSAAQMVMMNDDVWQGLPDAHQQAIAEASSEPRARASTEMQASEATDLEALRERGMTIVDEAAGLDLDAFRDSVKTRIAGEFDSQYGEFYAEVAAIS